MAAYQVWYAKNWDAMEAFLHPLCSSCQELENTHVFLREVEADTLDAVFVIQQGHNWSPNGEARQLIEKLGLDHTSMSTGDILRDPEGRFWECRPIGWQKLGKRDG